MCKEGRDATRPGLLYWLAAALALCAAACGSPRRVEAPLPPWVVTRSDEEFKTRLTEAFSRLRAAPAGALLVSEITAIGKPVVFRPWTLPSGSSSGMVDSAVVWWNPDFGAPQTPAFVALHHELVHAYQNLRGAADGGVWMEDEAVGLAKFAKTPFAENALRRELGLPHRPSHERLPGFSEEEMARRFHAAYADKDYARKRMAPAAPKDSLFPRIEVTIPAWVEEQDSK